MSTPWGAPTASCYTLRSPLSSGSWCSGLTCQPVTLEIAGSNPVGPATQQLASFLRCVSREEADAPSGVQREVEHMFGLGIVGTILVILLILWLLGVL
jgi:hypothetical protein